MLVETAVACVSLALTAALISAFQSMPVDELLFDVAVEFNDVALFVVDVALLTVMMTDPSLERPGRRHAGPDDRHQPSSLSRYCGIWLAAASADTAACVFT